MTQTGFNFGRSGPQLIKEQISAIDLFAVRKGDISNEWMRICSGTGLHTHPELFDRQDVLTGYVNSQKKHNWKTMWGIGSEDIAVEINRLNTYLATGLKIEAFYIGNEQYLWQKYRVTPEKYILRCKEVITALEHHGLPFLINISPEKTSFHVTWNNAIYNALQLDAQMAEKCHPDLHIYIPNEVFQWKVIDDIRVNFPGKPLWVTEYGAREDVGVNTATTEMEVWVANEIKKRLQTGDKMLSHMLANNFDAPGSEQAWINNGQWTSKGNALFDFMYAAPETEPAPTPEPKEPTLTSYSQVSCTWMMYKQQLRWSDGTWTWHEKKFGKNQICIGEQHIGKTAKEIGLK